MASNSLDPNMFCFLIQIDVPTLSLPLQEYSTINCKKCDAVKNVLQQYAQLLGAQDKDAAEFSNEVWEFESKLAQVYLSLAGWAELLCSFGRGRGSEERC